MKKLLLSGLLSIIFIGGLKAQYNKAAGQNIITKEVDIEIYDEKSNSSKIIQETVEVDSDKYGNAEGNQYDLAVDGAFEGQTVAVLHFYTGGGFDFSLPTDALKEKGFSVYRWINNPPSPEELEAALEKSCQLWIISSNEQKLNQKHADIIKNYFDSGKGVYIWGDNLPFYADANFISEQLIGVKMEGNLQGDQTVGLLRGGSKSGIMPNHLITTGLQNIYEGITIATINASTDLTPIIYGSAGNLVTASYEKDGKRLLIDGGFTRLYNKWDTAGTGRYVKNAAAWLANYERFGNTAITNEK